MKKKIRILDIFNLSFLDVISCGFGAIIMLVLISKPLPEPSIKETFDADLIGIKGNPLDDISLLENVHFVMKDGQVIK